MHDALVHSGLYAAAVTCAAAVCCRAAPARGRFDRRAARRGRFRRGASDGVPVVDATTRALWLGQCAALALAAATVAFECARARRLSRRIADLVAAALPSPEALRAAFGDPGLEIVVPARGRRRRRRRPADASCGARARSDRGDARHGLIAELRHGDGSPERIAAAARGAGLALDTPRCAPGLRAELTELEASRRRLVEIGDAERRRLERDLHDGAQQRLIAF